MRFAWRPRSSTRFKRPFLHDRTESCSTRPTSESRAAIRSRISIRKLTFNWATSLRDAFGIRIQLSECNFSGLGSNPGGLGPLGEIVSDGFMRALRNLSRRWAPRNSPRSPPRARSRELRHCLPVRRLRRLRDRSPRRTGPCVLGESARELAGGPHRARAGLVALLLVTTLSFLASLHPRKRGDRRATRGRRVVVVRNECERIVASRHPRERLAFGIRLRNPRGVVVDRRSSGPSHAEHCPSSCDARTVPERNACRVYRRVTRRPRVRGPTQLALSLIFSEKARLPRTLK